jgi:hypothetical protein
MINKTLIKSHPTVQLGHLYEHLFLCSVNRSLYEQNLFKYIDYAAHGATYEEGGIIVVDIDAYTEESKQLIEHIELTRIKFGEDNSLVTLGLLQIVAEKPNKLHVEDKAGLLEGLQLLDSQFWQQLDNVGMLDTKSARRNSSTIYLTDEHQSTPRKLSLSLRLDDSFARSNRMLMPLFYVLARVFCLTMSDRLAWKYGAYMSQDAIAQASPAKLVGTLLVPRLIPGALNMQEAAEIVYDVARHMATDQTLGRIAREFSSVSYSQRASQAPGYGDILRSSKILVGAKGWEEIASLKNLQLLLAHSSIELKFGRQKISRSQL